MIAAAVFCCIPGFYLHECAAVPEMEKVYQAAHREYIFLTVDISFGGSLLIFFLCSHFMLNCVLPLRMNSEIT